MLGNKVEWIEVIEGYEWRTGKITKYSEPVIREEECLHYLKGDSEKLIVTPNLVPHYSSDGSAMLELDAEMREKGWRLNLWFADAESVFVAVYERPNTDFFVKDKATSMPEAVALAAYKALTSREWKEIEGGGE